jgi:hypothetical protein
VLKWSYSHVIMVLPVSCSKPGRCTISFKKACTSGTLQWCRKGVAVFIVVLQWCQKGVVIVIVVLQWCQKGVVVVIVVLQWCQKGVAVVIVVLQWCQNGVAVSIVVLQWCHTPKRPLLPAPYSVHIMVAKSNSTFMCYQDLIFRFLCWHL